MNVLPMRGIPFGEILLKGSLESFQGAGVHMRLEEVMGLVCGKKS